MQKSKLTKEQEQEFVDDEFKPTHWQLLPRA